MTVKNFKPTEVKTSKKVAAFYLSESKGKLFAGKLWSDTIAEFDAAVMKEMENHRKLDSHYNIKCKCGKTCVLRQVKTNRNNNQGKYFVVCPDKQPGDEHTREFVSMLPLKASGDTATGGVELEHFTPGVDGAVADALQGKRFVVTGVFPELGGGSGLKLGRDNMKAMIESFGGAVTTGISGKTDYIIVGDEPGKKRLEEADKKGVPTIDRAVLRQALMGKKELQSRAPAKQKLSPIMKHFAKKELYEC